MTSTQVSRATLSEHNRSRVLHHVYHHGPVSRATIAKALELTPAAISKITAKLIEAGLLEETGDMQGEGRRRSIGLRMNKSAFHVASVKFARTLVCIGVYDLAGNQLSMQEITAVEHTQIPETLDTVHSMLEKLLAKDRRIIAIGMAVPGPYLRAVGRTAMVSSMQEWRAVNFIDEFSHSLSVPVFIEQDARAGVLSYRLFGQGDADRHLAYYLLGEGVGLGVIDGDETINGELGAATEIGHVSIDVNGRSCECGNVGCLERYCSAVSIHEELNESGIVADSESMTHREACEALFRLAASGNSQAVAMVQRIGTYVGYGAVTIINTFNPSRIIVGDIVSGGGDLLLSAIRRVVDARILPELNARTTIVLADASADASTKGAAGVAVEHFLANPSAFVRGL
ncbi:ROK family transcriptional regulator [Bifidobacterium gallicum]|nr:ROK family transcriptional regulator [Bifidobacterium gallicum]KFI59517.1 NagC family transcriptional regulator [Bifidobacterium gallicum DSM 20093 = LMG 11596]